MLADELGERGADGEQPVPTGISLAALPPGFRAFAAQMNEANSKDDGDEVDEAVTAGRRPPLESHFHLQTLQLELDYSRASAESSLRKNRWFACRYKEGGYDSSAFEITTLGYFRYCGSLYPQKTTIGSCKIGTN